MNLLRRILPFASVLPLALTGCGIGTFSSTDSAAPLSAVELHGAVHGGQQPVAGATLQLYAAGTSGYGSASRALIGSTVKTDANGNFSITGTYTCQTGDLVYLVATGGNPGVSGTQNNSALAEMAGLGPCSALSASTTINISELTTIASVWSLAPFMIDIAHVGTSSTNVLGLTNAFKAINVVASISGGSVPGPSLPTGATLPTSKINTLADILAACVNSVDSTSPAAQSSNCSSVFAASSTSASTPTNTIQAALNLAHTPTLGLSALTSLVSATAPFQPILAAAPDSWTLTINYVGGALTTPAGIVADASGNIWATDPTINQVSKLAAGTGAALTPSGGYVPSGFLSTPAGIAIDASGNAWIANKGSNYITRLSSDLTSGNIYNGGGLNKSNTVAIDAAGNVWVTNSGNNTVSEFSSAGTAISPTAGFPLSGAASGSSPTAIAVNPK